MSTEYPAADDTEQLETDVSAGWREEYAYADVETTIEPDECETPECDRYGRTVEVQNDDREPSVRCHVHARDYFGVSS